MVIPDAVREKESGWCEDHAAYHEHWNILCDIRSNLSSKTPIITYWAYQQPLTIDFFKCLDVDSVALVLMENIQSMEFRHMRQLIHSILTPLFKGCPSDLWEEGRARVPDLHGILAGTDLKVEVMEEKLLQDLTCEICSFPSVIASAGTNSGLPSLEQPGHVNGVDMSSPKDLDAFASSSMVVLLSISTNNVEFREFVAKDLFSAIIQGLSLELNAIISSDWLIFLSLPSVTQQDLLAFEEALAKTSSPKEQKQLMKIFLLLASGNKLKALAAQKSVNVITNVSSSASTNVVRYWKQLIRGMIARQAKRLSKKSKEKAHAKDILVRASDYGFRVFAYDDDSECFSQTPSLISTSDPRRPVQIWLITVDRVASVAMHNYKEKILKHDKERFEGYLEQVEAGMTKITTSAPLEVFVAVGFLISELSEEPWKGKLITFSEKPRLISVEEYKNLVVLD
ncbi:hypothetical protein RJ639_043898 [Escallonia herrerae]|uniref:Uncharacterized protein n=1 Tax=Escallonia herrerae TaxID=1293975 RepID=A0AA88WJD7_9ASTE|nr:hypothetical protein RJ639_043898 [Escallonia herrerae]